MSARFGDFKIENLPFSKMSTVGAKSAPSTPPPKIEKAIFESQTIAPAPSQTQVSVTSNQIILRDWPKKRISEKWTRDGALNPGSRNVSYDEFIKGELRDEIERIFGPEVVSKIDAIVQSAAK